MKKIDLKSFLIGIVFILILTSILGSKLLNVNESYQMQVMYVPKLSKNNSEHLRLFRLYTKTGKTHTFVDYGHKNKMNDVKWYKDSIVTND